MLKSCEKKREIGKCQQLAHSYARYQHMVMQPMPIAGTTVCVKMPTLRHSVQGEDKTLSTTDRVNTVGTRGH